MSEEHAPDDPMIRDYRAFTAKVAKILDVAGGLAAALDIADYRRVRDRAAGMLDVDAGLRATLITMIDKSPAIRFRILGSTVIRADGESTTVWGPRRERGVLAVLLLHAGQPMSTETILRWVWPDDAPRPVDVPATIHTYVARLRRKLRSTGDSYQIVARAGSYRLDVDRSTIDYHQFVTLRRDAQRLLRAAQQRQAADHARRAIELWQGRPLDDLNSERAENWRRAAVANEWLPANITLLEALLELGDHAEVLERIDALQPEHPHDLALMKLRLAALYALNRGTEATASYFTARRQLLIAGNDRAAEHLRQLHDNLWEGKAHAGAPIHAAGGLVPRQLPADTTFVGREPLLAAIQNAAQDSRSSCVITLEGMAGIGKTALAVHWAHSARHHFPDGDFFVDLNRFTEQPDVTVATVVDDLLTALGQPPDPALPQHAKKLLLNQLLADRQTLVILNDARDSHQVQELVSLLANSLVIVTTRERLATSTDGFGPHRITVGPMTTEEASDLLTSKLGDGRHLHEDDHENLVRLSQGSPLLISILAEFVLAQPDQQLLTRKLQDILNASTPAETESLFMLSYQALSTPERRLFRLLGLHPGPEFSLSTARAYGDMTTDRTRRSLATLVEAHLLDRADTVDRYRFHHAVHAFAARCAERDEASGARAAAEQRGIDHYTAAATQAYHWIHTDHTDHTATTGFPTTDAVEPVVFTNTTQARSWFDQERGNLVASVRAAAARGHHRHALQLAEIATALLDRHGHHQNSRVVYDVALTVARTFGDHKAEAAAQVGLGAAHLALGDHTEAYHFLIAGLRYAEGHGAPRGQAALLHQLGQLEMRRENPSAAVFQYRQALDIVRDIDDFQGQCWTHCHLGEAHRTLGQHHQAFEHLRQARWFAEWIEDKAAHATALFELGAVHRELGDLHTAVEHCEQALLVLDTAPTPDLAVTTRIHIALTELNLGRDDLDAAMRSTQRTIELARQTYDVATEARGHDLLGDVHAAYHDPVSSVMVWRTAIDLYERTGMTGLAATVRNKIAAAPIEATTPDSFALVANRSRAQIGNRLAGTAKRVAVLPVSRTQRSGATTDTFGAQLRQLRISAGMSLSELARHLNYSKSYLSRIENGQKSPSGPLVDLIDRILNAEGALQEAYHGQSL